MQVNSNTIVGLVLNQIRFVGPGGGYTIVGNSFTLTNSIEATNTAGANLIGNNISLTTTDIVIDVATTLTLQNVMSGGVGVIKNGVGTLTYAGANNTYTGTTTVNGGVLGLDCGAFFQAFGGPLVINSGATVRLIIDEELPGTPITINSGGTLDMNNLPDSAGTSLTLNGNATVLNANPLSLAPGVTVTVNLSTFIVGNAVISGALNVGVGPCTFAVNPPFFLPASFAVPATVSGSAVINKTGTGFMSLSASNSFTGQLNILGGTVGISSPFGLGSTAAGTTVSNSATLQISASVTNEALTIASSGIGLINASGANNWVSPIDLEAATTIEVDGVSLNLNGQITGTGGFTKTGGGTLRLSGPGNNSYAGDTTVNSGVLELNSFNVIRFGTLTIGDGVGGPQADVVRYVSNGGIYGGPGGNTVFISSSGLLDLNGFSDDVGPIYMDGATINTGTGTLQLFTPLATLNSTNPASVINGNFQIFEDSTIAVSNTLTVNAVVSGGGTFTKTGPGTLYLTGPDTYTGTTIVQQGFLWGENSLSFGNASTSIIVSNLASLVISGGITVTNKPLFLNGVGVSPIWGNLDAESAGSNTNVWTGPVTLNATNCTIMPYENPVVLRLQGQISGPGGMIVGSGGSVGTLVLEGSLANNYAGVTTVSSGTNVLNKSFSNGAIPGNLIIDGVVQLALSEQIANTATVTIDSGGLLDLGPNIELLDTLQGVGTLNFGSLGWMQIGVNNGSSTFYGNMTGIGYSPGYTVGKEGTGTFTMNGNLAFSSGIVHEFVGKLVLNGSQPAVPVIVENGSTLGGSGSVGPISAFGSISPGNSPGILSCGNTLFTSSGNLTVELTGPTPGVGGYDQLNVTGSNILGNASLTVIPGFTTPVGVGQQFEILANDGVDPINGTFGGLPEGSPISINGYTFTISYVGGTGNDVVLTLTNGPVAAGGSAVSMGNGNHSIDPNECNSLSLVISNKTGIPMTGITATLTSMTYGVVVNQSGSAYPDAAASGTSTNSTAFEITTLPSFPCPSDINLQLAVSSASHGSFIVPFVVHSGEPSITTLRFDNNVVTNCPDVGTIESTNNVALWTGGPVTKVAVSLWLSAPLDSDLTLTLISPDGTSVLLTSGNGGGANFGTGSADVSRTTFDDTAGTSISAGASPFVGTFRPQTPLSAFNGIPTAAGNWRLRVSDGGFFGNPDTLRAWSVFVNGTTCASGSGICGACPGVFTNSTISSLLTNTIRIVRDGTKGSCDVPKACPGTLAGTYRYNVYSFTNTSTQPVCITASLDTLCADTLTASAYIGSFDSNNPCNTFIGDMGSTPSLTHDAFTFTVPGSTVYFIVVNEVNNLSGCDYTLVVNGQCGPPILAIDPLNPVPNVRLHWPTSAGGYRLEATPTLVPTTWTIVTNEPIELNGNFNVTNTAPPPDQYYRLHKP